MYAWQTINVYIPRNNDIAIKLSSPTLLTIYGTVTQPAGIPVAIMSRMVVLMLEPLIFLSSNLDSSDLSPFKKVSLLRPIKI